MSRNRFAQLFERLGRIMDKLDSVERLLPAFQNQLWRLDDRLREIGRLLAANREPGQDGDKREQAFGLAVAVSASAAAIITLLDATDHLDISIYGLFTIVIVLSALGLILAFLRTRAAEVWQLLAYILGGVILLGMTPLAIFGFWAPDLVVKNAHAISGDPKWTTTIKGEKLDSVEYYWLEKTEGATGPIKGTSTKNRGFLRRIESVDVEFDLSSEAHGEYVLCAETKTGNTVIAPKKVYLCGPSVLEAELIELHGVTDTVTIQGQNLQYVDEAWIVSEKPGGQPVKGSISLVATAVPQELARGENSYDIIEATFEFGNGQPEAGSCRLSIVSGGDEVVLDTPLEYHLPWLQQAYGADLKAGEANVQVIEVEGEYLEDIDSIDLAGASRARLLSVGTEWEFGGKLPTGEPVRLQADGDEGICRTPDQQGEVLVNLAGAAAGRYLLVCKTKSGHEFVSDWQIPAWPSRISDLIEQPVVESLGREGFVVWISGTILGPAKDMAARACPKTDHTFGCIELYQDPADRVEQGGLKTRFLPQDLSSLVSDTYEIELNWEGFQTGGTGFKATGREISLSNALLGRTSTPTPQPTVIASATVTQTPEPTAEETPPPRPQVTPYGSNLALISPLNGAPMGGFSVVLRWRNTGGPLASNQHYDVRLAPAGRQPSSIAWSDRPEHAIGKSSLSPGRYNWQIVVVEESQAPDGSWQVVPIGQPSAIWSFEWNPNGGSSGGSELDQDEQTGKMPGWD